MPMLREIVRRIRLIAPRSFVVAVKLNAADYVKGGLSEAEALSHVRTIASWATEKNGGVDIIEVSGGDYENVGVCFNLLIDLQRRS